MTDHDASQFLRNALRGNAAFSVLSGLSFASMSGAIAEFFGGIPADLVLVTGIQLLVFAGALIWLASRPQVSTTLAMGVVAADVVWVLGTFAVISADVFSDAGAMAALGIAAIVGVFAVLQSVGVARTRTASA